MRKGKAPFSNPIPAMASPETTPTSSSTAESIKGAVSGAAAKVSESAKDVASRAADSASRMASERKSEAADRVSSLGSAIHDSARSLEEQDPNIAWLTHQAADRIERVADYVRQRDLATLSHDVEDWARRHPVAFFGGMAVLGVVIGAAVKTARHSVSAASGESRSSEFEPRASYGNDELAQQPYSYSEAGGSSTVAPTGAAGI